jgi:polysaccharide export outer membrane protein
MSTAPLLLGLLFCLQAEPRPAQQVPGAVAAPAAPTEYQIGPDDILHIVVYGNDDLTQTVLVQRDGSFSFPLVGRVQAAELTPKGLEQALTAKLGKGFIRNPQVTVLVQEYRSKTVFVVGEVARPGTYPLSGSTTLVELLSKAGPTTPNAGSEIIVVRPRSAAKGPLLPSDVASADAGSGPPKAEVLKVDMRDIQAGQLDKNVVLQPSDTIFVPQAPRVFVSGEVRNPGGYPFAAGTTVRQAISLAGGFTERASSRIRIARAIEGKTKELKVKLDDAVLPGDTIVVKEKLF